MAMMIFDTFINAKRLGTLFIRNRDNKIFHEVAFPYGICHYGEPLHYILQSEDGEIDCISNIRYNDVFHRGVELRQSIITYDFFSFRNNPRHV